MRDNAPAIRQLLYGARLFTGDAILADHALLIEGARILDLIPANRFVGDAVRIPLPDGSLLVPGFIDTQVNGGGGVLFNDRPDVDGLRIIAVAHRRYGTTGFLATLITDSFETMDRAANAAAVASGDPSSGVLGLHLEGPFLNQARAGIHNREVIRLPTDADVAFLTALPQRLGQAIVLLSLAPECVTPDQIRALVKAGVRIAGAHSAASEAETAAAIEAGLSGFTHLFNAMPPIAARAPGIATAALLSDETWCGIILDGIHVAPATLRLALATKAAGKLMLVTDAMPPLGTDITQFDLLGRTIYRRDGRLEAADGTLAGADLDMANAIRRAVALLGLPREEALRMASLYPAAFLGMDDRRGRLAPGFAADLTLLDGADYVLGTWVAGVWREAG